jgi:drug/metabolite transporter (DMT)-like permease
VVVVALGLAGIALTVGAPSATPAIGIVLGLAAAVGTAAFILGGRHLMMQSSLQPIELLTLGYVGPSIGLLIAAGVRDVEVPSATALGYAAGLTLVGTVLASILFYAAVPAIGAGPASLLCTVEPLVSVLLAYVVLDESLSATQLAGGALILTSVVALTLPLRRWRRSEEPVLTPEV